IPHTKIEDIPGFDLQTTYDNSDYTEMVTGHGSRLQAYAGFLERNGIPHNLYDRVALDDYDARLQAAYAQCTPPVSPNPLWRAVKASRTLTRKGLKALGL